MPGRKPIPPVLRLLTGNPGKRGVAKEIREQVKASLAGGPALRSSVGAPRKGMSKIAAATWKRIAEEAVWLTSADRELLETFCLAVELMRTDPNRLRTAAQIVRSVGSELGLSPAARVRLGTTQRDPARASDLPPELADATAKPAGA